MFLPGMGTWETGSGQVRCWKAKKDGAYVTCRAQRIHDLRVHVGRLHGPGRLHRDGLERGAEDLQAGRDLVYPIVRFFFFFFWPEQNRRHGENEGGWGGGGGGGGEHRTAPPSIKAYSKSAFFREQLLVQECRVFDVAEHGHVHRMRRRRVLEPEAFYYGRGSHWRGRVGRMRRGRCVVRRLMLGLLSFCTWSAAAPWLWRVCVVYAIRLWPLRDIRAHYGN